MLGDLWSVPFRHSSSSTDLPTSDYHLPDPDNGAKTSCPATSIRFGCRTVSANRGPSADVRSGKGTDWIVGVDVGGTFTDFAARNTATGELVVHKRPSTPEDPSVAIIDGFRELTARAGIMGEQVDRFAHGTTVATNALLQRKGAAVGVVTTEGFRDLLEIGRQVRPAIYDLQTDAPPPLAPRHHRLEVAERIGPDGGVIEPLTDEAIERVLDAVARLDGLQSIALCLLFSFRNPDHEERLVSAIRQARPDLYLSTSSEVQPAFREYERFSTTLINAFLQPEVGRYMDHLQVAVGDLAPHARFGIFQSSGGLMSVGKAAQFPVRTALSGPAAGAVGAAMAGAASGILCAKGLLDAELQENFVAACRAPLAGAFGEIAAATAELRTESEAWLTREAEGAEDGRVILSLDMRYIGQNYELPVEIPGELSAGPLDVAALRDAFLAEHRRAYGHADAEAPIEVVNVRARAVARLRRGEGEAAGPFERAEPQAIVPVWFDEIVSRTHRRMRAAIAQLSDGAYTFTDVMDDDGAGTEDIRIALTIRKTGERIAFDFAGSDGQVPGNFNLTFNATQSAVCFALKALLDPEVPNNQGIFDAIDINAPEGSIVNCVAPASVALRANTCQRVVDIVIGALAEALPDRAIAAANGSNTSAVFAGTDPRTGRRYVYLETLGGGMGARATRDGKDGVQVNITNTSNLPVEAIEQEYPLRVECYALVEGSGGAGRQRGGMGIRRIIRPIGHECEFNGVGERFRNKPWSAFGGLPGAAGSFSVETADGVHRRLPPKATGVRLGEAERVVIETPGAGGYGPPGEREPAAIREDAASGKFSADYLASAYPRWKA